MLSTFVVCAILYNRSHCSIFVFEGNIIIIIEDSKAFVRLAEWSVGRRSYSQAIYTYTLILWLVGIYGNVNPRTIV